MSTGKTRAPSVLQTRAAREKRRLADHLRATAAGKLKGSPLVTSVGAVSVGIIDGEPRLDLCYEEDSAAETDMNVVCTGTGDFVEVQGTAEREPFSRAELSSQLDLGTAGCAELTRRQEAALRDAPAGD